MKFVVIRIYKGRLAMSKPCYDCIQLFKLYNIRNVYYSNEEGVIVKDSVESMTNSKSSGRCQYVIQYVIVSM